jgi:hypothetical protein
MAVIHILKDGSVLNDITGRVVKIKDAGPIYQLLDSINRERSRKCVHKKQEVKVC